MFYLIEPDDELSDNWLFFEEDLNGVLVVREEYRDLVCQSCGKIDENIAISRGLSSHFIVETNSDIVATSEDWICVSARFCDEIMKLKFGGLRFIPLADSKHSIVMPELLVETDETRAGFENHNQCTSCGRFGERIIGPFIQGMRLPASDSTFFASSIANENVKVSYYRFFASELMVEAIRKLEFAGIDFVETA